MVASIGHNWDAAVAANLVGPIVQTMVVVHKIAGIKSYDEYDALRENRRAVERTLLQGFQETNNRGAKAFRDKARELITPFFVALVALSNKTRSSSMPCSPHSDSRARPSSITVTLPDIQCSRSAWKLRSRQRKVSSQPRHPHGPGPQFNAYCQTSHSSGWRTDCGMPGGCPPGHNILVSRFTILHCIFARCPRPSPCPGIHDGTLHLVHYL